MADLNWRYCSKIYISILLYITLAVRNIVYHRPKQLAWIYTKYVLVMDNHSHQFKSEYFYKSGARFTPKKYFKIRIDYEGHSNK